jgi:CRP-like cAMP-binding protein
MHSPHPGKNLDNSLLAVLPIAQFNILMRPHLRTIVIPQGTVLLQAGDEFDKVYFPHNGMISLLVLLENGKSVEIATVGREGVVGAMAGLGSLQVAGARCRTTFDERQHDFCCSVS